MAEHVDLLDPNIHEPKGISTASSGTVYVSNGAGSGSWTSQSWGNILSREIALTAKISDVSTASSIYTVAPYAGTVTKIYCVIDGTLATADATITTSVGGVPFISGDLTLTYSGSAAEDVFTSTPTANNTVSSGDVIKSATDGASTNTVAGYIVYIITLS